MFRKHQTRTLHHERLGGNETIHLSRRNALTPPASPVDPADNVPPGEGREAVIAESNPYPAWVGYTIRTRGVSSNFGVSLGNGGTPRRADEEWVVSFGRVKRYQLVAQTEHDLKVHLAGQECKESGRVFRSVVSIMREQLLRPLLHLESSYGARTWN